MSKSKQIAPAPVVRQVADLRNLSQEELKNLWRTLYGTEPPARTPES